VTVFGDDDSAAARLDEAWAFGPIVLREISEKLFWC